MSLEPGLSQQKISVVQEQTNDKQKASKVVNLLPSEHLQYIYNVAVL